MKNLYKRMELIISNAKAIESYNLANISDFKQIMKEIDKLAEDKVLHRDMQEAARAFEDYLQSYDSMVTKFSILSDDLESRKEKQENKEDE